MMLLEYLALCPFHVKNKLSINKELRWLVFTQVCSQVCTQSGHENGTKCLSSSTLTTQNSPPCCCRVRKSPQAWAGLVAGSRSPGGLRGRPQPIYAEQPGEKTEKMTQVRLGPTQAHVLPSTTRRDAFQEVACLPGNLVWLSPWQLSHPVLLVTWLSQQSHHLFHLYLGHHGGRHLKVFMILIMVLPSWFFSHSRNLLVFKIRHFKYLVNLVKYLFILETRIPRSISRIIFLLPSP